MNENFKQSLMLVACIIIVTWLCIPIHIEYETTEAFESLLEEASEYEEIFEEVLVQEEVLVEEEV